MADQRLFVEGAPPGAQLPLALRRLDRALLAVHVRQVTEREDRLQREWAQELTPILDNLYWEPVYQLNEAPDNDEDLEAWLVLLLVGGFAHRRLVANLDSYLLWGADAGGALALDLMGVGGGFHLTNVEMRATLTAHRGQLTQTGTGLSLIDTTVRQLRQVIQAARAAAESIPAALAQRVPAWVAQRVQAISISELSWAVARAQIWTYLHNNVAEQMFVTREDDRVCPICQPLHGRIVPVNHVPPSMRIPLHTGCRCNWEPVLTDWEPPATIWRGG